MPDLIKGCLVLSALLAPTSSWAQYISLHGCYVRLLAPVSGYRQPSAAPAQRPAIQLQKGRIVQITSCRYTGWWGISLVTSCDTVAYYVRQSETPLHSATDFDRSSQSLH